MKKLNLKYLADTARKIRKHIVIMSGSVNASHSGSALSPVEIITTLYFHSARVDPKKPLAENRDRIILSKGHGGAVLYAALAERGFFPVKKLATFCKDGSVLPTHPVKGSVSGVEATTGSLGHGLSIGLGMALAAKPSRNSYYVYVILSDGECDEGSVWEAVLFAGAKKTDNLVVFIDYNKIQSFGRTSEVLDLEPLSEKFRSFRWHVQEVDGHNFSEIVSAIETAKKEKGFPHCIIAHTVKGKGVSYMEDTLEWHYKSPTGDFMKQALEELKD